MTPLEIALLALNALLWLLLWYEISWADKFIAITKRLLIELQDADREIARLKKERE